MGRRDSTDAMAMGVGLSVALTLAGACQKAEPTTAIGGGAGGGRSSTSTSSRSSAAASSSSSCAGGSATASSTSSSSGAGGGAGAPSSASSASSSTSSTSGGSCALDAGVDAPGSVLGLPCPGGTGPYGSVCCDVGFAAECTSQGGFLLACTWPCPCGAAGGSNVSAGTVCQPACGSFPCFNVACDTGQVCNYMDALGESSGMCTAPPAACAGDLTCACLQANGYAGDACQTDADGNVTIVPAL